MKGILNSSYCLKEYHISILVYVSNRNIGQIHNIGFIYCTNITTKDCKGPQTNMPKNVGSINT